MQNVGLDEAQAGIKIAGEILITSDKQGDNIQPSRTPFPIWNESVVPCPVLTGAS